MTIFDGNKICVICKGDLDDKKRYFGMDLDGYTYVFCGDCFKNHKETVKELLHKPRKR